MRRTIPIFIILFAGIVLFSACGGPKPETQVKLAPLSDLPADIQAGPEDVQLAYRFALANKELLEQIPCFCGCSEIGHASNYECYVAEDGGPGNAIQFDKHGFG